MQVKSIEEGDELIDSMHKDGSLDPAFLLTMAKAYSGVKESEYTKDDTKEVRLSDTALIVLLACKYLLQWACVRRVVVARESECIENDTQELLPASAFDC